MTIGDIDLGTAGVVAAGFLISGGLLWLAIWWKGRAP